MNLKSLYIAIPTIIVIALNIMYGSAISWMLSIGIIACLLYFFAQISIEQLIFRKTNVEDVSDELKAHAGKVIKKYKIIFTSGLLTVAFLSSLICIYRTTNPAGSKPWFFNNDYHAISNTGIAFDKDLNLTQKFEDSLQSEGNIHISKHGVNGATLEFKNFYEPVFAATEIPKIYTPVNNIFPNLFHRNFTISNGINTLSVTLQSKSNGFFSFLSPNSKAKILYDIQLTSKDKRLTEEQNIQLPYNDHLQIESSELTEGKSLYNLLLNSRSFNSEKSESYAVLEFTLRQLGESYLLMNYKSEDEKGYTIFPSKDFMLNGYHLKTDDVNIEPQTTVSYNIAYNKAFYIGFHNIQAKNYIAEISNSDYGIATSGGSIAFMYDYPASYLLSGPESEQRVGNKNMRFVSNNNDDIIASDLREGFYFNNNGLQTGGRISGKIDYLSQSANEHLSIGVADNNNVYKEVNDAKFHLRSTNAGEKYLFSIRDFSQNGFHFHKLLLFATLIYFGMLALLLFFPGKNLVRIEPIIFTVIYLLLILRLLLYWRLATFPPLENI